MQAALAAHLEVLTQLEEYTNNAANMQAARLAAEAEEARIEAERLQVRCCGARERQAQSHASRTVATA